tara:strand:+ start:1554 stop:1904 length:351 start_codon:yes stop_codon:yes gene_type:complete
MSSNLVLIPFDDNEGRFQGDSFLPVDINIPFNKNLSKSNIKRNILEAIVDYYGGYEDCLIESEDVTGCWIIEADVLKTILRTLDLTQSCSSDSEEYKQKESIKYAIDKNSTKILIL